MHHEHAEHIAAPPEAVFTALADVENLPRYVPQMTAAEHKDGDVVAVEARYDGHDVAGEAWFRTDADARSIEWGVGDGGYHGRMAVEPDGEGSRLLLELDTTHVRSDDDVRATLDAIRRLVESTV